MTAKLGKEIQIVGDDLLVTNPTRGNFVNYLSIKYKNV
jgi:enolase